MHAQAMPMAPVSSSGDDIPFGAALTLSLIAVAAAIGQICGCFLPSVLRPWQLVICCIFFASSASLFGVVFSRRQDNHRLQNVYLMLALFCSVWPPIYEVEFLYKLLDTFCRMAQRICIGTTILMLLLDVGFCTWIAVKTDEVSLVMKPLLFATIGVYAGLVIGYFYLASKVNKAKNNRFALLILLCNGFICSLMLILTGVLLGVGWASVISADLILWIFLTSSSVLTVRFLVLLAQKELIKSIFGFTSETGLYMRSLTTMADQSTKQNSTASLVSSLAVHKPANLE